MRALLLSAGLGTRLRPITDNTPKCLVEINGVPLLGHWLDMLTKNGIKDILINLHYLGEKVEDYVNKSIYAKNVTMVYEKILLGTAGTLLANKKYFGNEPLMLIHADNLSLFNVHDFIETYHNRDVGVDITMMTFTTTDPKSCGIVQVNENGVVHSFREKVANPQGNLANAAVYIIAPSIFNYLENLNKKFIEFSTDVLPYYMGRVNVYHNDVYHRDIGTVDSLELARREYPNVHLSYHSVKND